MNGALVMYYDDRRREAAELCIPEARLVANRSGDELIVHQKPNDVEPYTAKQRYIRNALFLYETVIYSDVDVLFRPGSRMDFEFPTPILLSEDDGGLCCGFMAFRRTEKVAALLTIWAYLGLADNSRLFDQSTFALLWNNFSWVRDLTSPIPQSVVSNPKSGCVGSLAHHFWHHNIPQMATFQFP